mmetsp:Transcript_3232/g.5284  ORF Transcript_3232/g.5284 Transcript_3232/m.5284 type:complete len:87 (-) Transcript_3232:321-581(-)
MEFVVHGQHPSTERASVKEQEAPMTGKKPPWLQAMSARDEVTNNGGSLGKTLGCVGHLGLRCHMHAHAKHAQLSAHTPGPVKVESV